MPNWLALFIAGCAALITVTGAAKVVVSWLAPVKKFNDRVKILESKADKDYTALTKLQETNQLLCKGVLGLLDNKITGNSIDRLKVIKHEMQEFLINR